MVDQPIDVGDEKQVERAHLLSEIDQIEQDNVVRVLLGSSHGREFLHRFFSFSGINMSAPLDSSSLQRYEGRRDAGLWMRNQCLTADPNAYSLIAQEFEIVKIIETEEPNG